MGNEKCWHEALMRKNELYLSLTKGTHSCFSSLISCFILLFLLIPCLTLAQKKELSQARSYIKSGKDYDKAEQLMTKLLQDSVNRGDKRIYQVWYEAVKGQYNQANERLYLHQKQDTAAFFALAKRMFSVAESLDSLDILPDKKGKVSIEYRQKHREQLNIYRPNLMGGGTYFVRKEKWSEAYNYLETYIDCARQPLFAAYHYDSTDVRMPEAGYWATYCGYMQHDPILTLRYRQLAVRDTARAPFALQFIAEARRWLNDDELYVMTLEEGFRRFPQFPYFFPRLMDAYSQWGQYDKALALADSALAVCDTCELYLFSKSSVLLRLQRWEESITYSDAVIQINDSLPEPYFNLGTAYVNMASALDPRKEKKQYKIYYQKACQYMEHYRQLMPAEKDKWAPVLYRIYLNLNMGKQFDEIDRILKQ